MSTTAIAPTITPPPDMLYERVAGQFVEKNVSALALWLATELCELINQFARPRKLGRACNEMVFILDTEEDRRRRPDVAFVPAGLWSLDRTLPWKTDWPIVPNLAVEIISPGNSMNDMMRKRREYFQYGVEEVWIVLPEERQVHCYTDVKTVRILDAADVLTTPLLPEWSLKIGDWLPILPEDETQPSSATL